MQFFGSRSEFWSRVALLCVPLSLLSDNPFYIILIWRFNVKYRPEINARHSAFKRGAQYLQRYCLLIAFAAFLERKRHTGRIVSFSDWLASRPDIEQGLDAIHQNPGGALAPVPASRLPTLWVALSHRDSQQVLFSSKSQTDCLGDLLSFFLMGSCKPSMTLKAAPCQICAKSKDEESS
jgi:hypothetical protein